MKGRLLLDVIIGECSSIFQLLSSEDETLLVWWDTLFVLYLSLDIFNSIRRFNFKGDGLSSQGFDKNLHSSSETEYKMKSWFLLDVIIGKSSAIFQLFASKD